jgi:hypothetical protein
MTDIIERAEAVLQHSDTRIGHGLVRDLVTELKAARAEQTLDAAGLAAVPRGAIVRSAKGTIACRYDELLGVVFGDERPFDWNRLSVPATLLWEPK